MPVIASLNFRRSSAFSIACSLAPIISTPYFASTPWLVQVERAVQRGLAAHRRQHRVGPFLGDDLLDHLPGDRLDVGDVGHLRVGHDRRRVGVDQDDPVALLAQRLAGLRAGVVELAGLADDDRAGADDQDVLRSVRLGIASASPSRVHQRRRSGRTGSRCRAARARLPGGPGSRTPACRCAPGPAACRRTATRASARRLAGSVFSSTAKPWFWLVMLTRPLSRSFTGWLAPWWPNFILKVLRARGQRHDLVAQADAEGRHAARRSARASPRSRSRTARDRRGRWTGRCRRACSASTSAARRLRRHHRDAAAALGQHAQDVALDAVVVGDHVEARVRQPGRSRAPSCHSVSVQS